MAAGKEVREMEREQTTIRLPLELKAQLGQEAKKKGMSFNSLVILLIGLGLNRVEPHS